MDIFDTDPQDLKPQIQSAYTPLNVQSKILSISKDSNDIIESLAKINMDNEVMQLPVVKLLLDVETITLNTLYKSIVYHTHMIDSMMIQADNMGSVDTALFFQISELSSRSTALMTEFTIFLRTLPKHFQQLSSDLLSTLDVVEDLDSEQYADGEAGNEQLISELDSIAESIKKQNAEILDEDLESNLKFDPNTPIYEVSNDDNIDGGDSENGFTNTMDMNPDDM